MAGSDGSAVTDFPGLVSLLAVGPGRTQLARSVHPPYQGVHGSWDGRRAAVSLLDSRQMHPGNQSLQLSVTLFLLVILWLLVLHWRLVSVEGWNEMLNISNSLKSRPSPK